MPWRCTRRPGHTDDEHRAAFELHGDGPRAWSRSPGITSTEGPVTVRPLPNTVHTVTVTVTFPESAATGVDADRIAADVLSNFWECDHDHVRVAITTTNKTIPLVLLVNGGLYFSVGTQPRGP